eukprot:COSAG04_NODE_543_length_12846_cov_7.281556_8_plen_283_part_00
MRARLGLLLGAAAAALVLAPARVGADEDGGQLDEEDWVFDDPDEEEQPAEPQQVDPNAVLMRAAREDDLAMAKQALADGADPNYTLAKEEGAWTVMQMAFFLAQVGRWVGESGAQYQSTGTEIARALIEAGAEIDTRRAVPGGSTALQYVCEWGKIDAVKMLLELGADVNARGNGKTVADAPTPGKKRSRKEKRRRKDKTASYGGNTALMAASWAGQAEAVRHNTSRNTFGAFAQRSRLRSGCFGQVRLLLEAGADAEITNEGGIGPLRMATEKGHDEIAVR